MFTLIIVSLADYTGAPQLVFGWGAIPSLRKGRAGI